MTYGKGGLVCEQSASSTSSSSRPVSAAASSGRSSTLSASRGLSAIEKTATTKHMAESTIRLVRPSGAAGGGIGGGSTKTTGPSAKAARASQQQQQQQQRQSNRPDTGGSSSQQQQSSIPAPVHIPPVQNQPTPPPAVQTDPYVELPHIDSECVYPFLFTFLQSAYCFFFKKK
jgi:hypothetical protein